MAYIKVIDDTDEMEVTIFPKLFKEKSKLIEKNAILVIEIKTQTKDDISYIAENIKGLEEE